MEVGQDRRDGCPRNDRRQERLRRALLVGIDAYGFGRLEGCVADAAGLAEVLATNADRSPNWRADVLLGSDDQPSITRDVLRDRLSQLFKNARDTDLLFFFAG